ncbi:MAG: fatty acid--CoA ligase family protein, partial [Acidimicrobiales bacterium]
YKERELDWILRHCDAQYLFTIDEHLGNDYLDRLEKVAPGLVDQTAGHIAVPSHPYLRSVWTWGPSRRPWAQTVDDLTARPGAISEQMLAEVESEVTPADPMVVVYSSGSTADPKGAVHSHGAVVRHAHNLNQLRDVEPGDVFYTLMPLFWVGGLSFTLVAALHIGATLVFEDLFEPAVTLDLLETERVTHVMGWPHMTKALMDHPTFADHDLSAVRGGAMGKLLRAEQDDIPPHLVPTSLGMTETLGPHTFELEGTRLTEDQVGSFGRSVPGVEHRVVDPATGAELAIGETGEVQMRGYSLMQGLHKIERSDTFTPDGWYSTGDGGHFDADGHLYFAGRLGNVIKASGMNITPREVEAVLEGFDDVALAFVTGVPHPERGADVVAAVVLEPGADPTEDDLRKRVKDEIASYKVPRRILAVHDQKDLPWLDTGKINLRGVTQMLVERFAESEPVVGSDGAGN